MGIVPSTGNEEHSLSARGDPFNHLRTQVNRVFDDFGHELRLESPHEMAAAGFWPQVDVTETDKEIKVCANISGCGSQGHRSDGRGRHASKERRNNDREENEKGHYRMKRSYGAFERTIALPVDVNESKAKAEFKKGVLKLTLPKRPGATSRRKKIPVS